MERNMPRLNGQQLAGRLQKVEYLGGEVERMVGQMERVVFGQTDAMTRIARLLVRGESMMKPPNRPIGSVLLMGPTGCLHPDTPIYDPVDKTTKTVKEREKIGKSFNVYSLNKEGEVIITQAFAPVKYKKVKMYRVRLENGAEICVTGAHKFLSHKKYVPLSTLYEGYRKQSFAYLQSSSESDLLKLRVNAPYLKRRHVDFQIGYHLLHHLYGLLPQLVKDIVLKLFPSQDDVHVQGFDYSCKGAQETKQGYNHQHLSSFRLSIDDYSHHKSRLPYSVFQYFWRSGIFSLFGVLPLVFERQQPYLTLAHKVQQLNQPFLLSNIGEERSFSASYVNYTPLLQKHKVISIEEIESEHYYDFHVPIHNNYWACGFWNHNCGKTATAEAVAKQMFGTGDDHWKSRIFTVDCSSMTERHQTQRLTGAPPGYVGYGDRPLLDYEELASGRSVVVFDEIEKADPAVWKLALPIMDEARLTVRQRVGNQIQEIDIPFQQSFLIFTSNIGAGAINDALKGNGSIGFRPRNSRSDTAQRIEKSAMDEMHRTFQYMPEFPARFDDIIVYKPLEDQHYYQILDKYTQELSRNNRSRQLPFVVLTDECRAQLVKQATKDKRFGAREMRQVFNTAVVANASDIIMSDNDAVDSHYLVAHFNGEQMEFYINPMTSDERKKKQEEKEEKIREGQKKKEPSTMPVTRDEPSDAA